MLFDSISFSATLKIEVSIIEKFIKKTNLPQGGSLPMRHGYIIAIQASILLTLLTVTGISICFEQWIFTGVCILPLLLFFAGSLHSRGFWESLLYKACASDLLASRQYTIRSRLQKGDMRFLIVDTTDQDGVFCRNLVFRAQTNQNWDTLKETKSYQCWLTDSGFVLEEMQ